MPSRRYQYRWRYTLGSTSLTLIAGTVLACTSSSSGVPGTDASTADATAGLAVLGSPCSSPAQLACAGHAQKVALICNGGTWMLNMTCGNGQLCDTGSGVNRGTCASVDPLCATLSPGDLTCADATHAGICGPDLVSHTLAATCVNEICVHGACVGGADSGSEAGDSSPESETQDAPGGDSTLRGDGGDAAADAASDAPAEGAADSPNGSASCTCGSDASCFYDQTPPGPVYGTVGEIVLTPSAPTANFTAAIIGPGSGNHDGTWYDLNLSAFASGGTVTVTGTSSQCAASSYLVDECFVEPATGDFTAIRNDSDVPAGTQWTFSYQFSPVAVLHLGTECNWGTAQGATGTNAITVSVAGAVSDAAADVSVDSEAPDASCTCDGGGSCFYDETLPGPVYGTVSEVVLTPSAETASFTAAIIGPGSGNHDGTWYDLDLSAFTSGGTMTVTGTSSQCAASSYLVDECFVEPATGDFTAIRNDSDVPAGTQWTFSYQFPPVPVLHLGTECN